MGKKYSCTNGQSRGKSLDMKELFVYGFPAKGSDLRAEHEAIWLNTYTPTYKQ